MKYFKRKISNDLLEWKNRSNGKTAMLIEGPRRVGKTTVAVHFAENYYKSSIVIDFSDESSVAVKKLINEGFDSYNDFFLELQRIAGVKLEERNSLIVFDEIQLFPKARQMIKHLVKDGRYDYLETGSLISIKQNVKNILIPSEEERLEMHPMDFEEFLWAKGDDATIEEIKKNFDSLSPVGEIFHKNVMKKYYSYMLVGGMPQAVDAFLTDNNYSSAEFAKRNVLSLYLDDMEKIKPNGKKCKQILSNVPALLSRRDKTFKPSQIKKNARTREYIDSVYSLADSKTVNVCWRCSDPSSAMGLYLDDRSFKIYMADTGLLFSLTFDNNEKEFYSKILEGKSGINKGMFFENAVAQELAKKYVLYFSKFSCEKTQKPNEVDFLIPKGNKIDVLEVKSSKSSMHKSLDRFSKKYGSRIRKKYVIHTKNLKVEGDLIYIPIYMTMFI